MTVNELKVQNALGLMDDNYIIEMLEPLAPHWYKIIPRVSKEVLTFLSDHKHNRIRYYVAGDSNTPIEVLRKLSKDEDWMVRANADVNIRSTERERCKAVE